MQKAKTAQNAIKWARGAERIDMSQYIGIDEAYLMLRALIVSAEVDRCGLCNHKEYVDYLIKQKEITDELYKMLVDNGAESRSEKDLQKVAEMLSEKG